MNYPNLNSSPKIMEKEEDGDKMRLFEYRILHFHVHTSCSFSNLMRNIYTVFWCLKGKKICFEFLRLGVVSASYFQYFYSICSPVVTIDAIVVQTSFARIKFLTGRLFDEYELHFFLSLFLALADVFDWSSEQTVIRDSRVFLLSSLFFLML